MEFDEIRDRVNQIRFKLKVVIPWTCPWIDPFFRDEVLWRGASPIPRCIQYYKTFRILIETADITRLIM